MQCRICGDERDVLYRQRSRQFLCRSCHAHTPAKVSRETFERLYWAGDDPLPCQSIRDEFWDDYRSSGCGSVAEYIRATVEAP